MLFDGELGRFPSLHGVAGGALAAIGALGKLTAMRIGLVTIHAFLESQRLLKVPIGMALRAVHIDVLAFERILRLRVVEALADRLQRDFFPPARAMTRLATLREAAVVRVFVAIRALVERDANILRFAISAVRVALGALHLRVQASQRIARLRVVELTLALADADRLPVFKVVARLASRSKAAFVLILVACNATCRQPEVSAI